MFDVSASRRSHGGRDDGTCSEKMQAIHCMSNTIRERRKPAIIADVGGMYIIANRTELSVQKKTVVMQLFVYKNFNTRRKVILR